MGLGWGRKGRGHERGKGVKGGSLWERKGKGKGLGEEWGKGWEVVGKEGLSFHLVFSGFSG
jgi:hypothetical protein